MSRDSGTFTIEWAGPSGKSARPGAAAISYRFIQYQPAAAEKAAAPVGAAVVTLACPQSGNLIDGGMAQELRAVCQEMAADAAARLVVVTGAGDCFSVGRQRPDTDKEREQLRVAEALAGLDLPALVALNGDAIGQGLELALAGDLRLAADTARLGLTAAGCPELPWDGGTQRLPRLVGPAWALDLALTGRTVTAAEALRIGLVNRVTAAEKLAAETWQLAAAILAGGPVAIRYAREAVYQGLDLSLAQGLRLEADLSILLHGTADRAEGIASFREGRKPRFEGG